MNRLYEMNIGTGLHYKSIAQYSYYKDYAVNNDLKNSKLYEPHTKKK